METLIRKTVKGATMEAIFNNCETLSVRHFKALDLESEESYNPEHRYKYEINVRHADDEDANVLFQDAIVKYEQNNKIKKTAKIEIKTTGIRGNAPKLEVKGQVVMFIDNPKAGNYICADAYIGQGVAYQKRPETLIEIREDYNVLFAGTFTELLNKLKA